MDGTSETSDVDRQTDQAADAVRYLTGHHRPPLGAKVLRLPPGMQAADGFAIRLRPGQPGSVEKTTRRIAPLLAAGKKVTLDLSSLPSSSTGSGSARNSLVEPLLSISQALAARGDRKSVV